MCFADSSCIEDCSCPSPFKDCRCRDLLKSKNTPKNNTARPATPPITPPTIAPTGVLLELLLCTEDSGVAVVADGIAVDRVAVDECVVNEVGVTVAVAYDEELEDERIWQESFLPGPPSIHPLLQNLTTLMSPLSPPIQWKSVLEVTLWLLGSRAAFLIASLIWS